MKKAAISKSTCDNSPFCPAKRACPQHAIVQVKTGFMKRSTHVEAEKCTGCSICLSYCPHNAIAMKKR